MGKTTNQVGRNLYYTDSMPPESYKLIKVGRTAATAWSRYRPRTAIATACWSRHRPRAAIATACLPVSCGLLLLLLPACLPAGKLWATAIATACLPACR